MVILGISAYHPDSAAALIVDGVLVAAVEEERLNRQKHWAGFPSQAIEACLRLGGKRAQDIDIVAVNSKRSANIGRKIRYLGKNLFKFGFLKAGMSSMSRTDAFAKSCRAMGITARIEAVEHHLAHLASGWYESGFEDAALVSIDGMGDFSSGSLATGKSETITVIDQLKFPDSLGIFYQAMTQFLGFNNFGDEYKVMGLSAYGEPEYAQLLENFIKPAPSGFGVKLNTEFFRHHSQKAMSVDSSGHTSFIPLLSEAGNRFLESMTGALDFSTKANLARSTQDVYEKCLFQILNYAKEKVGSDNLVLTGGCAMNSLANGKITSVTAFKSIYIPPSSGDAGGAVGAALVSAQKHLEKSVPANRQAGSAYLGNEINEQTASRFIKQMSNTLVSEGFTFELHSYESLIDKVAAKLALGAVVGWCQGRSEFGPRALGNRSILFDPRRKDAKEVLNLKIKLRENFRPFAPAVLAEHQADWFEDVQESKYMSFVKPIKREKRGLIPGVTHTDGTGRLQTVSRDSNKRFWDLITKFESLTDVPMLINTSFNENEPIVDNEAHAYACFARTGMDLLVLDRWIVERKG